MNNQWIGPNFLSHTILGVCISILISPVAPVVPVFVGIVDGIVDAGLVNAMGSGNPSGYDHNWNDDAKQHRHDNSGNRNPH